MDKPHWLCHITNQYALPMILKDKKIHPEGYSIMQNKVATPNGHVEISADIDVSDLKNILQYSMQLLAGMFGLQKMCNALAFIIRHQNCKSALYLIQSILRV